QPGILHHVLGIGDTAQHPVRHRLEQTTVLTKQPLSLGLLQYRAAEHCGPSFAETPTVAIRTAILPPSSPKRQLTKRAATQTRSHDCRSRRWPAKRDQAHPGDKIQTCRFVT